MKIRYLLRKRGTPPQIYLALYANDLTELIYTGQRIPLTEWSTTDRAPKQHDGEVFQAIEKVKKDVQRAMKRLEADEKPLTPFTVKQEYDRAKKATESSQQASDRKAKKDLVTVTKLATQWLENDIFGYRKSTQKSVTESINAFTSYLKSVGLANLERKDLTQQIITSYDRYLLEKRKLADNTHGKRMKQLRWFLKSIDFDISKIKIRSSKKTIVSLTLSELTKLENVEVFEVEQQKAKDLFLLGCFTGLRISDLKRLNHINTQNGLITLKLLKNDKLVKIPIIAECARILAKYNYHAPKISEQALNEKIKEVCDKAGIDEKIGIESTKAGKRVTTYVPKHEVITSHIAGKTFISLAPEKWGLTPAEIASIVGKDLKTLINSYFNDQGDEARRKIIQMDTVKLKVS